MFLPGRHIPLVFLFLTIFVTTITVAYPHPEDDKTFNLKIGFDLTHGENGAPALRIRDFEDSKEFNPRAAEDDDVKKTTDAKEVGEKKDEKEKDDVKKALRAGSSSSASSSGEGELRKKKGGSNSNESDRKKTKDKSKEAASEDSGSGDSEPDAKRSTRGLGDADPEDVFKPKPVARDNDDDDDDRRRKRSAEIRRLHKRAAEKYIEHYYENVKRKHKKVHNVPLIARSTTYKPY